MVKKKSGPVVRLEHAEAPQPAIFGVAPFLSSAARAAKPTSGPRHSVATAVVEKGAKLNAKGGSIGAGSSSVGAFGLHPSRLLNRAKRSCAWSRWWTDFFRMADKKVFLYRARAGCSKHPDPWMPLYAVYR